MSPHGEGTEADRASEIARKDAEWAAKADTPLQTPGLQTPGSLPGGQTTAGGPGGGPSAPSQPYRTPKNLRSSTGPRFSGRGVLAVFGILGVLLTVGIMVFLFVKVIDGVSGDSTSPDDPSADIGTEDSQVAPGLPDTGGGAELDPTGPGDAARAASCETERATIETAKAAFEIDRGRPPGSFEELEAAFLRPPDGGFSHTLAPDGSIVGTGDCAPG